VITILVQTGPITFVSVQADCPPTRIPEFPPDSPSLDIVSAWQAAMDDNAKEVYAITRDGRDWWRSPPGPKPRWRPVRDNAK
jgi:hypothetical protein